MKSKSCKQVDLYKFEISCDGYETMEKSYVISDNKQ